MEENVALDSSKQKDFSKSVKGIKKLIKNKGSTEVLEKKFKDGKVQKRKRRDRGLVYLGHIPHGFYEDQMTQYFKQFGVVTNVRVIKSQRTGRSKGYAFVEFKEPSVAEIVAETMNNYLMGKRLLKAQYIPPEKQRRNAFRKKWNAQNNPAANLRQKLNQAFNEDKDDAGDLKKAKKLLTKLSKMKKKLNEMGLSYDFFEPVDVPVALTDNVKKEGEAKSLKKEETDTKSKKRNRNSSKNDDTTEIKVESKLGKKAKKEHKFVKPDTNESHKIKLENKASVKTKVEKQSTNKKQDVAADTKQVSKNKKDKALDVTVNKNSKVQRKKQEKLKSAGVSPPENYIQIKQDSDNDSDSSLDFDSDEFEKMILAGDESADSDNAIDDDEDFEESEVENEVKPSNLMKLIKPNQKKKQGKQLNPVVPPKKGKKQKFEKNKKGGEVIKKKQFKKKK